MSSSEAEHKRKMQKLQATHQRKQKRSQGEKGLIIVNAGLGKGKTTAALGMAFRALGHGMKVGMVQFIKGNLPTGEQASVNMHSGPMDLHTLGEGFTWDTQDRERDVEVAGVAWKKSLELLEDPQCDLVILDELNLVLKYDYLPVETVTRALARKRGDLHVVITGRYAPRELLEMADLATEMKVIKHPYSQGIKAQKGLEF